MRGALLIAGAIVVGALGGFAMAISFMMLDAALK